MAVDVRIMFEQDRPKILHVKRNEAKIVVFDVLGLHRYNYTCIGEAQCLIGCVLVHMHVYLWGHADDMVQSPLEYYIKWAINNSA